MKELIQLYTYNLILEEYIKDIEQQIIYLEIEKNVNQFLKKYVTNPEPAPWDKTCSKCGLKLEGVMGYCCPNAQCPTGLGPVMC